MSAVSVSRGEAPLLVSLPHTGTELPDDIAARLVSRQLALKDTDWHIEALYAFVTRLGATTVQTRVSRTVIDVNRDPSGRSLYPGQATTGLVPLETFDGEPLYREGFLPDVMETERRKTRFFAPYHAALEAEIIRLKALHPRIVVYDCHSIRSVVPRLFPGELPVFNIGTNGGTSCDPALAAAVEAAVAATGESFVVDGRFRGGWITRHYGRPREGVHAIQMELAQRFYMNEADPARRDKAKEGRAVAALQTIIGAALAYAQA
jgi:formiminoglutamase